MKQRPDTDDKGETHYQNTVLQQGWPAIAELLGKAKREKKSASVCHANKASFGRF